MYIYICIYIHNICIYIIYLSTSKGLYLVTLHSSCHRAITFQNFFQASELAIRRKEAQWEQSQLQSAAQVYVVCACVCTRARIYLFV